MKHSRCGPRRRGRSPGRSTGGARWDLTGVARGREFRFDGPSGSAAIYFDPQANLATRAFTEWIAYDETANQDRRDFPLPPNVFNSPNSKFQNISFRPQHNVNDVRLRTFYERVSGNGVLRLQLTKLGRTFIAQI